MKQTLAPSPSMVFTEDTVSLEISFGLEGLRVSTGHATGRRTCKEGSRVVLIAGEKLGYGGSNDIPGDTRRLFGRLTRSILTKIGWVSRHIRDAGSVLERVLGSICFEINVRYTESLRTVLRTKFVSHVIRSRHLSCRFDRPIRCTFYAPDGLSLPSSLKMLESFARSLSKFEGPLEPVAAGCYSVVLEPVLAGLLIHEVFGHLNEADVAEKHEVLPLGARIAPKAVTIIDDPTIPGLSASYVFDDDGFVGKRVELVSKGVVRARLTSQATALQYGGSNGHGRCSSYQYLPLPRMSNIYLRAGRVTPLPLIERVENGLYLLGAADGSVDPTSGMVSLSAERGWTIRKGRFVAPIGPVRIFEKVSDVLSTLTGIASDLTFYATDCIKGSQMLTTVEGAPHISLGKVLVIPR